MGMPFKVYVHYERSPQHTYVHRGSPEDAPRQVLSAFVESYNRAYPEQALDLNLLDLHRYKDPASILGNTSLCRLCRPGDDLEAVTKGGGPAALPSVQEKSNKGNSPELPGFSQGRHGEGPGADAVAGAPASFISSTFTCFLWL